MIDEETHKLFHLNRSQNELKQALEETPDDADFRQAITENEAIIVDKEAKIIELQRQLEQCDPAYRMEMRRQREAAAIAVITTNIANDVRNDSGSNVSVPAEATDTESNGIYL